MLLDKHRKSDDGVMFVSPLLRILEEQKKREENKNIWQHVFSSVPTSTVQLSTNGGSVVEVPAVTK